jgi:hypothetical protein
MEMTRCWGKKRKKDGKGGLRRSVDEERRAPGSFL